MALSAGTRLGPYEILAPLGAGGMGEVYRARDPRLKREIALKVVPAEVASEPERLERFEREAQTLAALNHPHIVTIHSVEEAEGLHFLTMELVEGKTLTKVIPRGGLPLPHFFRIAIPLTEAVSAAHEKGITHRDLKPGNVMVTEEDRVKVLDFGLAKLRQEAEAMEGSEAPTARATEAGRVMGTAPYMSPEQVQGKPVDHRSDVFSLGIMLYEMVTGDRPFQGDTSAELASSILRDTPASVTERKADLPRDLGKLIKHCLEKEPTRRLQSVLDVRNELEELRREVDTGEALTSAGASITARRAGRRRRAWLVGGAIVTALALAVGYLLTRSPREPPPEQTASVERKMLVVLPFENLGAPDDAYFAAGMTEEITNRLARVSGLGVISRTSAIQYDRSGKTLKQVGSDLGVDFVLEGSVRWERLAEGPGWVRISPKLIGVADDTHVWARTYDRELDSIFAVQSEIAEQVVGQLGVTLRPDERKEVVARPTDNLEAYEAYLRGRQHFSNPDVAKDSFELAVRMFQRAVEHDPRFAPAYAWLSVAHSALYWEGFGGHDRSSRRLQMARDAAARALEIDPASPNGHMAQGYYHYWGHRDYERALEHFAMAKERLPNDSQILQGIGAIRRRQGRFGEAIELFKKALELDPRDAALAAELAWTYQFLRQYQEADRCFDLSISFAPNQVLAYRSKADGYLARGLVDRARATLQGMPKSDHIEYCQAWVKLERYERNFQAALDRLAALGEGASTRDHGWRELSIAELNRLMHRPDEARGSYEVARAVLEKVATSRPDDAVACGRLALAYAGLGRETEAIREAKHAVEILPIAKDAFGTGVVEVLPVSFLARVFAMVGEREAALEQIEYLLSIPSRLSVWDLRLDPRWDPLRDDPGFKKIVGKDWRAEASP